MKTTHRVSAKVALFSASVALLSAGLLTSASATNGDGYAKDSAGNLIRNTDGACLHNGAWTPAMADPSCEAGKAPVAVMSKAAVAEAAKPMPAVTVQTIPGYVTDGNGKIARNVDGTCWRTANWTPALAVAECQGGAPAAMVAKTAPAMEAKAAAPAPATAPVATATGPMTVSADGLFDFGKSTLRKGADAELAPIAAKLKAQANAKVTINGHTDRLGSAKLNMKLSKARAESVKAYMVGAGLKAAQITTQGMGSSTPVTKADQCPGKESPAVIACLQADRRVTILAQ